MPSNTSKGIGSYQALNLEEDAGRR